MGKYLRKSKTNGGVTLLEVSHAEASLGVLTRAKKLALRGSSSREEPPNTSPTISFGSYIQLRSRRLKKTPQLVAKSDTKRQKQSISQHLYPKPGSRASLRLKIGESSETASLNCSSSERDCFDSEKKVPTEEQNLLENNKEDQTDDASFGENVLESESIESSTWETLCCSSPKDTKTIMVLGSSMKCGSLSEGNSRAKNSLRRDIPTTPDMDEFFADAEERKQRQFIEKYNFDPVHDKPLPGYYEWVKMDSSKC